MNPLLRRLAGGTLLSDGRANEVADAVLKSPRLLPRLLEGLADPDAVVRGRTAHALERISRSRPEWLRPSLDVFLEAAGRDSVPMVKWHLAMLLGALAGSEEEARRVLPALYVFIQEPEGVFVRSWAIVSLCRIGCSYALLRPQIVQRLSPLVRDPRPSIRVKAEKALACLSEGAALPAGWVKSGKPPVTSRPDKRQRSR